MLHQAASNLIVKRRGHKLGNKAVEDYRGKCQKSKEPGLGQAAALKVHGCPMRLLLIRFSSPELLLRFFNTLVLQNSLISPILSLAHCFSQALVTAAAVSQGCKVRCCLLPRAWVRRATAAAAINATIRSFVGRCRHAKIRSLCDMRLRCRSVVVLQRWWRWSVCMKHRLIFLSSLRTSLHALGGGKILMAERQTLDDLDIDRSETSSQLLLETKCDPAVASGTGPRILLKAVKYDMMCNRRLVPKWVNHQSSESAQGLDGGDACVRACNGAYRTVTRWSRRQSSAIQHARVCSQPRNNNRDPPSGSRRKNRHAAFFPDRIGFICLRMTRTISMSSAWAAPQQRQ